MGDTARPVVIVCADEHEGARLAEDLEAFTGQQAPLLAAREFLFHPGAAASRQWEHKRISLMGRMLDGSVPLLICTVEGLMQRTMSPDRFREATMTLSATGSYDLNELAEFLARAGYTRSEQVEGVGQFALRGGILDFYYPAHEHPVRVEFWDTEVDSMGLFDISSQRRTTRLEACTILPVAEVLPAFSGSEIARVNDCSLPAVFGKEVHTAAHYLPMDAVICLSESSPMPLGTRCAPSTSTRPWRILRPLPGSLR
jgi:transcription-repair coupling factor (superfamily II helicase)